MSEANSAPLEEVQQEKKEEIQKNKINSQDSNQAEEIGGPEGPEPTRFGDWERKGRCIDF